MNSCLLWHVKRRGAGTKSVPLDSGARALPPQWERMLPDGCLSSTGYILLSPNILTELQRRLPHFFPLTSLSNGLIPPVELVPRGRGSRSGK